MGLYLVAAITLTATLGYAWVTLKVLIGLGLVIFVHELGHFLVAKACGVKCEKFYLGFDVPIKLGPIALPRTLAKFVWGETEYGVGIIPLGGYVKMLGQDDNPANAQQEAERIRVKKSSTDDDSLAGTNQVLEADEQEEEFVLDPRSFPAKSVPQRMAIISAGVIMNLIFAVIFAAVAYRMGVIHEPCEIGGTSPGSPAWVQNVPVGAKVVQIGRSGIESEHLRFTWDLRQQIALSGIGDAREPIELRMRTIQGNDDWVRLAPSDRLSKIDVAPFPTIGVRPTDSTTLSSTLPVVPHMAGGDASPPFEAGDQIIGCNGKKFGTTRANSKGELPADDLEAALAANRTQSLSLLVRRTSPETEGTPGAETLEITLPANRMRRVGIELQIGPVAAVRNDSPAAAAGFRVGDRIVSINGKPVGDPILLPARMEQWIDQDVTITVNRSADSKESESTVELVVKPETRFEYTPNFGPASLVPVDSIGIAYSVENQVVAVESDSPASKAGIQPGDVIKIAQFVASSDEEKKLAKKLFGRSYSKEIKLTDELFNWPYVSDLLQKMPPTIMLKLKYERSGTPMTADLQPRVSDRWYYADRGLRLLGMERTHTATTWGESWSLGLRETKEKLLHVVDILGKFVTLQLSPKNLGGPLMIAAAAGSEASQGIPRLLLFLTFLSANLAILNFLPIPALDGGHMVFLTAEAVTGKPVDERLQGTLTLIGVVCLLGLMVFVFANDIHRLFL